MPFNPIPIAQVQLGEREIRAVERVLKSGHLRAGPITADFEDRFASAVGSRYAIAVSSGTAALHLACLALLQPGEEVIVPDFTFVATAAMVAAVGAQPVFADVDRQTCNLTPTECERRITARTRAILPVHLFGRPADIAGLTRLAKRHNLKIIWDAAQAHGGLFHGRDVGSFPDVVCYSFYPTKNMTTGEGGMLTTSDAELAGQLRLLRSHGEQGRYLHLRLGFNLRLTDMAAAIGRVQLRKLPAAVRRRQRNAAFLIRHLAGIPGIELPYAAKGVEHSYSLFTLRLDPVRLGISREAFQKALAQRNIETAIHYPRPLHQQPLFAGHGTDHDFPVSTQLAQTVLSLPVHPALTQDDLRRIAQEVGNVTATSASGRMQIPTG
jgi:perosamine synthetase